MEQWYTLNSKPQAEHRVAAALQQRGFPTYLPEATYAEGKNEPKKRPFFPGYLFIKVDFETVGLSKIRWIPGLIRVIAFDNRPVPLADNVIKLIQSRLGQLEVDSDNVVPLFKSGDLVRVSEGPFRDMVGIFDRPTTSAKRVKILLDVLGQASRVEVNIIDLVKAPSDTEPGSAPPKRPRRTRGGGRRIKLNVKTSEAVGRLEV